jgi:hypothetical protein
MKVCKISLDVGEITRDSSQQENGDGERWIDVPSHIHPIHSVVLSNAI